MKKTTFEYMGELAKSVRSKPAPVITVQRNTTTSKYQLYLLTRFYAKRIGVPPKFITLERKKSFADRIKGIIEEHSVFNALETRLFILEGFYNKWIQQLSPTQNTYIVAETDSGELSPVDFTYREIRNFLRILVDLNELRRENFTFRALASMDWSTLQSFEGIETVLNKAHIMKWSEDELRKEIASVDWNNALTAIKRGTTPELIGFMSKISHTWFLSKVTKNLADLIHYRSLRAAGHGHEATIKLMDLHPKSIRARELEEVNTMFTPEDTFTIATRMVDMDSLILRNPVLGTELLALNAPSRLRK